MNVSQSVDLHPIRVFKKLRRDILRPSPLGLVAYLLLLGRNLWISRGEFFVPPAKGWHWSNYSDLQHVSHFLRYEWAAELLRALGATKVLDFACGSGYGSRMLVGGGASVVGADANPRAVAFADSHHGKGDVKFLQLRDGQLLSSFGPASFDAIVSFETVEHLEGQTWVDTFYRLLKGGGMLLLSTPLVGVSAKSLKPAPSA
jgi:2-polyprenyl-3-methyl-5-hydroxy-6-metoxy-1,4-benzoquinol methylase